MITSRLPFPSLLPHNNINAIDPCIDFHEDEEEDVSG